MHKLIGPRKVPKQSRSTERFQTILSVTMELIAEIGYENTTTDLIALRSGISVGSLYQFFPNKETIVFTQAEQTYLKLHGLFFAKIRPIVEIYRRKSLPRVSKNLADEILYAFEDSMNEASDIQILQSILYTHPMLLDLDFKSNVRFAKSLVTELFQPLFPALTFERSMIIAYMIVECVDGVYTALMRDRKTSKAKKKQLVLELRNLLGIYFQSLK